MKHTLRLVGYILFTGYSMMACISEQSGSPLSEGESLAGDEIEVIEGGVESSDEQAEEDNIEESAGDDFAGERAGSDEISGEQAGTVELAGEQVAAAGPQRL